MTSKSLQSTKIDWIRRIVVLLRRADARQLRDIYFLVQGYLGPRFPGTGSAGPEEARVRVQ
nr:MAG TPA: hypothetical protein [Caudoviricetes sp.]